MRVLTGISLCTILFASASSRNISETYLSNFFLFFNKICKNKRIFFEDVLIFFFKYLILSLASTFTSSICESICFNDSILFLKSVFELLNSPTLKKRSISFLFSWFLLRIIFFSFSFYIYMIYFLNIFFYINF